MTNEDKVYLGRLDVRSYQLTAIGRTESEVVDAIRQTYNGIKPDDNPRDDHGNPASFEFWRDYAEITLHEMRYGKTEWL